MPLTIHYQKDLSQQPTPNQPWLPSVHGVIVDDHGSILLHQREDHPSWALPGGKLEPGESLTDCLIREMKEETGLDVQPQKLIGVFSSPEYLLSVGPMVFQPLLIVFLCQKSQKKPSTTSESVSFSWVNRENIDQHETFPLVKEITKWVWSDKDIAFFSADSFL
ncbi:MAG: NUDIX domain-containing protein [Candidatus Moranbacteria bacterium]|nr:NUDIX domain-containing protein [Candidatus Moranbacteria bacterium]